MPPSPEPLGNRQSGIYCLLIVIVSVMPAGTLNPRVYPAPPAPSQGLACAQRPSAFILAGLLLVGACCSGLAHFKVETSPQRLWVGPGSQAAREKVPAGCHTPHSSEALVGLAWIHV